MEELETRVKTDAETIEGAQQALDQQAESFKTMFEEKLKKKVKKKMKDAMGDVFTQVKDAFAEPEKTFTGSDVRQTQKLNNSHASCLPSY